MSDAPPKCPTCGEVLKGVRRIEPAVIEKDQYWDEAGQEPELIPNPDRRGYGEHEGKPDCPIENVDPVFQAFMDHRQQKLQLEG